MKLCISSMIQTSSVSIKKNQSGDTFPLNFMPPLMMITTLVQIFVEYVRFIHLSVDRRHHGSRLCGYVLRCQKRSTTSYTMRRRASGKPMLGAIDFLFILKFFSLTLTSYCLIAAVLSHRFRSGVCTAPFVKN